ncbi:IMP cyclohydrolase [Methanopyrus sp.]
MYVGRFLLFGRTESGTPIAVYGVCSRSFPDRRARVSDDEAHIVPEDPEYAVKNPYVVYPCARVVNRHLVLTNGAQTVPIADKLEDGVPPREALASVTLAMDYEHDEYGTPRIGLVTDGRSAWLGKAAPDEIAFVRVEPGDGEGYLLSVYGEYSTVPREPNVRLTDDDPLEIDPIASFDHFVCAVVARRAEDEWRLEGRNRG